MTCSWRQNCAARASAGQLIEHVYAAAAAACSQVYWLTHETNTTAQGSTTQPPNVTGFIHFGHKLDG